MKNYDWLLKRYQKTNAFEKAKELSKLADELDTPLAQIALAWCLKNSNVSTVITGASTVDQLHQNLASLEVVEKLDSKTMQRIEQILANKPQAPIDWRER